jgi:hypothetical protein
MTLPRLIVRELLYRRLNFALGLLSVAAAVACLVAQMGLLRQHDRRTEAIIAAKAAETRQRMAQLEDDYRKVTLKMGFNVLILPRDQNLADLYADDYASKFMPEEYATRLAKSRVATINHILPTLQQKVKWPERERTILLMGVRGVVYLQSPKQKPLLEPVTAGTMVLGHELARNLQLAAGDQTKLLGREFIIARINPERGNKDDITVWINLTEAQELLDKKGQINAILALDCTCDTLDRLARIRAEISRILPDTQVIEFQSQALARAETRQRAAAEAAAAIEHEKAGRARLRAEREAFAAILVPVALLGAAIWIAYLAFSNARDRVVEIGVLRALGLRSRQILLLVLGRAVLTGIGGALAGWGVAALIAPPVLVPVVLVAAPLLTMLACWLPALWAAQQDPATILSAE